jgi:hypothetical protein
MELEYYILIFLAITVFPVLGGFGLAFGIHIHLYKNDAARLRALCKNDPERAQACIDALDQARADRRCLRYHIGVPNIMRIGSSRQTVQMSSDDELATLLVELRSQARDFKLTASNLNRPVLAISMAVQETGA